jgi:hypothetical protein
MYTNPLSELYVGYIDYVNAQKKNHEEPVSFINFTLGRI